MLPLAAPFLPDTDEERAHRHDSSACESSARRSRLAEQAEIEVWKQDQVAWGQTWADSPDLIGSRFACRHTRTRLPHFWHQRACAPIWHLATPTFPDERGSVRGFLPAMLGTGLAPAIASK